MESPNSAHYMLKHSAGIKKNANLQLEKKCIPLQWNESHPSEEGIRINQGRKQALA
jgi:hypothetical protein